MQDRVPTYPGRVKLTPVEGLENTYTLERADEPTQVGTPLSKATLLSDAAAASLGLTGDPTVSDAFESIGNKETVNKLLWTGTGQVGQRIDIDGFNDYIIFRVTATGASTNMLVFRHSDYARGIGATVTASGTVETFVCNFQIVDSESVEIVSFGSMTHLPNGNHGAWQERTLSSIYGLV